jgi:chromosome segregation ATPase
MNNIFYKLEKYNHKYHSAVAKKQNYKLPLYTNHKVKYLKELLNNTKILMKGGTFSLEQLQKANDAVKTRYDTLQADNQRKQAHIDTLDAEVARLQAIIAANNVEIAAKNAAIAEKDAEINRLTVQVGQVQAELQTVQADVAQLTQELQKARADGDAGVYAIQTELQQVTTEKDALTQQLAVLQQALDTTQTEKTRLEQQKATLEQEKTTLEQQVALANAKLANALGKYNVLYKSLLDSIKVSYETGLYDAAQIQTMFVGNNKDAEIAYVLGGEEEQPPEEAPEFFD